jgi:predicted amidophosphoribosyltransferase
MSVFKRANWHSGLTYKNVCPSCQTEVEYKDDKLGFRPWFPDGFVYCPTCEKPLRHNENLAIDAGEKPKPVSKKDLPVCKKCGKILLPEDKFCSQCGTQA